MEDPRIPESGRTAVAQDYAEKAVALLQKAVRDGYQDVEDLLKNSVLDPLRTREDFQELMKGLESERNDRPSPEKRN